jgi:hypothetical protein
LADFYRSDTLVGVVRTFYVITPVKYAISQPLVQKYRGNLYFVR